MDEVPVRSFLGLSALVGKTDDGGGIQGKVPSSTDDTRQVHNWITLRITGAEEDRSHEVDRGGHRLSTMLEASAPIS